MKTITWTEFLEYINDENIIVEIDGMKNVNINFLPSHDSIAISWEDDMEEYTFHFLPEDNQEIPVRKNEMSLFSEDKEADIFTFTIFNKVSVVIGE